MIKDDVLPKLAITAYLQKTSVVFELVDFKLVDSLLNRKLISIKEVKQCPSTEDFLNNFGKKGLLQELTEDQLLIALYFYLKKVVPSQQIIYYWLIETSCNTIIAGQVAQLVYETIIEDLDKENLLSECIKVGLSKNKINSNENYCDDISQILNELSSGHPIHWKFDNEHSIPFNNQERIKLINISNLTEALFQLEDHNRLIIGLINSTTSMIELLCSYKLEYLEEICKIVPLGLRDILSVGSALRMFPEMRTKILITAGMKEIELFGMDSNGILRKFPNWMIDHFFYSNIKFTIPDLSIRENRFIPLFLNLIK